jgi:predicted secreted protein|tara:strand:+ start:480 stop:656 length:177 start_codon:yes stop_codon:yes gene_type:complete
MDVNRTKKSKIEGEDPGSPENPKILKKFINTSIISSVLFLIIYYLVKYNYLNLRNFLM